MTRDEIIDILTQTQERNVKHAKNLTREECVAISEAAKSEDRELAALASSVAFNSMKPYITGRIIALGKKHEMEDELQNAFIALHTQLYQYDPKYSLVTFFNPILMNAILFENRKQLTRREKEIDQYISKVIVAMKRNGIPEEERTTKKILDYIRTNLDPDTAITEDDILTHEQNRSMLKSGDKMSKHEHMVKRNVERAISDLNACGNIDPTIMEIRDYILYHYGKAYSDVAIKNYFQNNKTISSMSMFSDIEDPMHSNPLEEYIKKEKIDNLNEKIDSLDPTQRELIRIKLYLLDNFDEIRGSEVSVKEIHKIYQNNNDRKATLIQVRRTLYEAERTLAALLREDPYGDAHGKIIYEFADADEMDYENFDEVEYEDIIV